MSKNPHLFNRPRLSRHRPADEKKLITEYATLVGRVLWEWNAVHAYLFWILWGLIGDGGKIPSDKASAIWHAAQTDDGQRKLLRAFAQSCLFKNRPLLSKLNWALNQIDAIGPFRNIAAHLPQEFIELGGQKTHKLNTDSVRRSHGLRYLFVEARQGATFWDEVSDDLYILGIYIYCLTFFVAKPDLSMPMPYKPRLRSISKIRDANAWVEGVVNKRRRRRRRPKP